jgi:predicted nucleic acid-binding protein
VSTASLDEALTGVRVALPDTSVLLAFLAPTDATHTLARHLFRRIESGEDPLGGLLSVVTAAEAMVRPARAGNAEAARMRAFLTGFPHLAAAPIDLEVATVAAGIRARAGLKMPDALIGASALVHGADGVVTNDEAWAERLRPLFPGVRWVYLPAHL